MINLMYVVLMAMLALNVSTDVLKGFTLVGNSLDRTIHTTEQENKDLLADLAAQYRKNPAKVKPWWDKAQTVQHSADSLCRYIDELKWAIARETDGADLMGEEWSWWLPDDQPGEWSTGPRVGVSGPGGDGERHPWRFWLPGEPSVSAYRPGTSGRRSG